MTLSLAYSPDGRLLALAGGGEMYYENPGAQVIPGKVHVRDGSTGALLRTLGGHTNIITSLAFSPDGAVLATGSRDQTVKLWDPRTGALVATLAGQPARLTSVAFDPSGARLAVGGRGGLRVWDVGSQTLCPTFLANAKPVDALAYSPDGKSIATCGGSWDYALNDAGVFAWDAETGALIWTKSARPQPQDGPLQSITPSNRPRRVAFSPDGRTLAVADASGAVSLLDPTSGKVVREFSGGTGKTLTALAFSPDGRTVAVAGADTVIRLLELSTGRVLFTLRGHMAPILDVAFARDGTRLASAGTDKGAVWDLNHDQRGVLVKYNADVKKNIVFTSDPGVAMLYCDVTKGRSKLIRVRAADGRQVNEMAAQYTGGPLIWPREHNAFSADGRLFAAIASDDGASVEITDTRSGRVRHRLHAGLGPVLGISLSPDGRRLAVAHYRLSKVQPKEGPAKACDFIVPVWDLETGRRERDLELPGGIPHKGQPNLAILAFSPDGRFVAGNFGTPHLTIWDRTDGRVVRQIPFPAFSMAFSPDGAMLAAVDGRGRPSVVLRTADWTEAFRFSCGPFDAVAFSPDGLRLVAADAYGTLTLWAARYGHELLTLPGLAGTQGFMGIRPRLAISPDGTRIATMNNGATTNFYDAGRDAAFGLREPDQAATIALPSEPAAVRRRAEVLLKSGLPGEAVAALSPLVERSPTDALALRLRGRAYRDLWDAARARADLERARMLAPDDAGAARDLVECLGDLAEIAIGQGRLDQANEALAVRDRIAGELPASGALPIDKVSARPDEPRP